MKKIIIILIAMMSLFSVSVVSAQEWEKINLPVQSQENIKKILAAGEKFFIFSPNYCFVASVLNSHIVWEESGPIPHSPNLNPVYFQGKVYLNAQQGLCSSEDGLNWELINENRYHALAANNSHLFTFGEHPEYASKSEDGINFTPLEALNTLIPNTYHGAHPVFKYGAAFGDTLIIQGFVPNSTGHRYESYDAGETWYLVDRGDFRVSDMFALHKFEGSCFQEVGSNYPGFFIITQGCLSLYAQRGRLSSTAFFQGNTWFVGRHFNEDNSELGGIIIKNIDITTMLKVDEPLNHVRRIQDILVAVGDSGAVYMLKDELSTTQEHLSEKELNIYPNPAKEELFITGLKPGNNYRIINLDGKVLINFIATENEQQRIMIDFLPQGIYFFEGKKIVKL
jgi:hypothetical protein